MQDRFKREMVNRCMFSPCILCDAGCCKEHLITITSFDVLRISEKTGKKIEEFVDIPAPRLLNYNVELVLEWHEKGITNEGILSLKSHPCIFLKNNRCSIHESSPLSCKLYPYSSGGGLRIGKRCPLRSSLLFALFPSGDRGERYKKEIIAYAGIVKEWNRERGGKADMLNFIMKRTRKRIKDLNPDKEV
ncbi:YkgJ family cysteine cluster protein [Candidatus Micrarchaeota archaeon]|nr:YkgJ family cysteine cluster protein [Candidatus Micrarchaeota archaeon]